MLVEFALVSQPDSEPSARLTLPDERRTGIEEARFADIYRRPKPSREC